MHVSVIDGASATSHTPSHVHLLFHQIEKGILVERAKVDFFLLDPSVLIDFGEVELSDLAPLAVRRGEQVAALAAPRASPAALDGLAAAGYLAGRVVPLPKVLVRRVLQVLPLPHLVHLAQVEIVLVLVFFAALDVDSHRRSIHLFLLQTVINVHTVLLESSHFAFGKKLLVLIVDLAQLADLLIIQVSQCILDFFILFVLGLAVLRLFGILIIIFIFVGGCILYYSGSFGPFATLPFGLGRCLLFSSLLLSYVILLLFFQDLLSRLKLFFSRLSRHFLS